MLVVKRRDTDFYTALVSYENKIDVDPVDIFEIVDACSKCETRKLDKISDPLRYDFCVNMYSLKNPIL